MNELYLDIGNSFLKLANQHGESWQLIYDGRTNTLGSLVEVIKKSEEPMRLYVSSVRKDLFRDLKDSLEKIPVRLFDVSDIPGDKLDYDTPETFGFDRFLVCLGAWSSEGTDTVVVDSGSACTVDLMTADGVYRGGVIMPGLDLLHGAIEDYLPELPVSERKIPGRYPGKSTGECLEWGVNGTYLAAISGFVERYRKEYPKARIFLTGGDSERLSSWFSGQIDATVDRNLIWKGMKRFRKMVAAV